MINQKYYSPWTSFLYKDIQDPFLEYKEKIALRTDNLIAEITNELLTNKEYSYQVAKNTAISVVMEKLLETQYQNTPDFQKNMVIALFTEMPNLIDFKINFFEKIKQDIYKPKTLFEKIKYIFS